MRHLCSVVLRWTTFFIEGFIKPHGFNEFCGKRRGDIKIKQSKWGWNKSREVLNCSRSQCFHFYSPYSENRRSLISTCSERLWQTQPKHIPCTLNIYKHTLIAFKDQLALLLSNKQTCTETRSSFREHGTRIRPVCHIKTKVRLKNIEVFWLYYKPNSQEMNSEV